MNKKYQNFIAVDAYLTRLCSSLMHDIAGIGSAPRSMERIEAPAKGESRRKQLLPRFLRAPRKFSTLLNWA